MLTTYGTYATAVAGMSMGVAERIELEVVADEFGEGVEAFAHVAGLQRDIDF
jgi:hypothetical protein